MPRKGRHLVDTRGSLGGKLGRPRAEVPADAAQRIRELAADGWSLVGIAEKLGTNRNTLAQWFDNDPALQEALEAGREQERHTLHNMLYRLAMEQGDKIAALFLLKARHGYRRQLGASCPGDLELLKAWLEGDWTTHVRGAFFGAVLDQSRNLVERWPGIPAHWPKPYLAHDFGSSAPSTTYIIAVSPGDKGPDGRWYPRDSLIAVDELATNEPGRLDRGMGYTVPVLAEQIKEMCARWPQSEDGHFQRVRPTGVADDAIFSATGSGAGSISDEFRRAGVSFAPAKKADRLTGWNVMRRLLQDAGKPDLPGLYIARHCEYAWETLPALGRDPRRVEDLDSRGPDHAADALRYGCLRQVRTAVVMPFPAC